MSWGAGAGGTLGSDMSGMRGGGGESSLVLSES